jgi:chitinase
MAGITPPRNVIYFSSNANQRPLSGIANLPYTDVIVAFLVPDSNLKLVGAGGAFDDNLQSNIRTLQNAGKNVLISFGGAIFPSSAYQSYAQNVNGLVDQIVNNFVTRYGFNGVDIDFEDDAGFTGTYDGIGFLSALTSGLAQALPGHIITHAPQTPYWDPNAGYDNAYTKIWQQVGNQITWINNQFYDNPGYDQDATTKVTWYQNVAAIIGAQKLLVGALVGDPALIGTTDEGYITLDDMINNVIAPLKAQFGAQFGGVMGWEFADDGPPTYDSRWRLGERNRPSTRYGNGLSRTILHRCRGRYPRPHRPEVPGQWRALGGAHKAGRHHVHGGRGGEPPNRPGGLYPRAVNRLLDLVFARAEWLRHLSHHHFPQPIGGRLF